MHFFCERSALPNSNSPLQFAHKETTEYEQTETFNSELVMAERGVERYVHLKSKDDEYEHLESHMPRKEREEAARAAQEEEIKRQMEAEEEVRFAVSPRKGQLAKW